MMKNLSKHSKDDTPKGSAYGEDTFKIHIGEGKIEQWRKMEISIYDGEYDAYSWIKKLEHFFQMKDILKEENIQETMVVLDGNVLSWLQWWETCDSYIGRGDFKLAILGSFQTLATLNPFACCPPYT